MTINVVRSATIPDDPARCVNWAYRTFMPAELNFRCSQLQDTSKTISAADAQLSGLGASGGILTSHFCVLFGVPLSHEYGVGVFKCDRCKSATKQEKE